MSVTSASAPDAASIEQALHRIEVAITRGELDAREVAERIVGVRPIVVSTTGVVHDPSCFTIRGRGVAAFGAYVTCRHCAPVWHRGWCP